MIDLYENHKALLWEVYDDTTSSWIPMPDCSSYSMDLEDLDVDSYRSTINGNIVRDTVVGYKWANIKMAWNYMNNTDFRNVKYFYSKKSFRARFIIPYYEEKHEMRGYISKIHIDYVAAEGTATDRFENDGWAVNFDFVEGTR